MPDAKEKERFNLFYIFEEDKKEHPLPKEKLDKIRAALFSTSGEDPPT